MGKANPHPLLILIDYQQLNLNIKTQPLIHNRPASISNRVSPAIGIWGSASLPPAPASIPHLRRRRRVPSTV